MQKTSRLLNVAQIGAFCNTIFVHYTATCSKSHDMCILFIVFYYTIMGKSKGKLKACVCISSGLLLTNHVCRHCAPPCIPVQMHKPHYNSTNLLCHNVLFISYKFVKDFLAITFSLLVISSWNFHDVCQCFVFIY